MKQPRAFLPIPVGSRQSRGCRRDWGPHEVCWENHEHTALEVLRSQGRCPRHPGDGQQCAGGFQSLGRWGRRAGSTEQPPHKVLIVLELYQLKIGCQEWGGGPGRTRPIVSVSNANVSTIRGAAL